MPDLGADGMANACELLMRGCLHVVAQENPKMFVGLLACDEGDARERQKTPRLADNELAAGGREIQGYAAVKGSLSI